MTWLFVLLGIVLLPIGFVLGRWAGAQLSAAKAGKLPPLRRFIVVTLFVAFVVGGAATLSTAEPWGSRWAAFTTALAMYSLAAWVVVIAPRFWRAWIPSRWRGPVPVHWLDAWAAFVILTAGFATLHTLLATVDAVAPVPELSSRREIYFETTNWYLRNAADTIPLLDVADTLDWKVEPRFPGHANGLLLLAYKVLVIVPVLNVALETLSGSDREHNSRSARRR